MRSFFYLLLITVMAFQSCAPKAKKAHGPVKSKLGGQGTQQIMNTVNAYYGLKNALVATDEVSARAAALNLAATATAMAQGIADSPIYTSLKFNLDTIIAQSRIISEMQDKRCEKQRIAFSPVSDNMFAMLKSADIKNGGIYQQFCPMAFNDKGAYWLSDDNEIKNPYFGKKMLECGEITDSL